MEADCYGEKIKLWEMENFDLILEVSNLMTYESRDEKGPIPGEGQRETWRAKVGKTPL